MNDQAKQEATQVPESLWSLFVAFNVLAAQGFGAAAPVAYRELVERRRWLTPQSFAEDWAVAQLMPGPNVVNLSLMLGDRYFGWRGALTGITGLMLLPIVIALTLTVLYDKFSHYPAVNGVLQAMGAVAAGLIIGTALKLLTSIQKTVLSGGVTVIVALVTFLAVAVFRWPLLWVLLTMAGVGTWWVHRQMSKLARRSS